MMSHFLISSSFSVAGTALFVPVPTSKHLSQLLLSSQLMLILFNETIYPIYRHAAFTGQPIGQGCQSLRSLFDPVYTDSQRLVILSIDNQPLVDHA